MEEKDRDCWGFEVGEETCRVACTKTSNFFLLHWDFGGQKIKPLLRWGLTGHSTHPVPCCSCLGVVGVGPLGLLFPEILSSSTHDSCVQGSPSNVTGADLGESHQLPLTWEQSAAVVC